jgi:phosphate transport system substrate-binding protein
MLWRYVKMIGLFSAVITLVSASAVAAGLRYKGSVPVGQLIIADAAKSFSTATGIAFSDIDLKTGAADAFKAVMEGRCDIVGLGRALNPDEKKQQPYYKIIGYDAIVVFVNAKNGLNNLTRQQLHAIFTGTVTNWKDVGGDDAPILVAIPKPSLGRAISGDFRSRILDGKEYGAVKEFDTPEELVAFIGNDPHAIGYESFSYKTLAVKFLAIDNVALTSANIHAGTYLLSRPLALVAKEPVGDDVMKFIDFLMTPQGQFIVGNKFIRFK